jgi:hypothetical protein
MRGIPFFKGKKGIQFAGANFDSGGSGGSSYVLPAATSDTLGGVKIGTGLSVTEDGTLSASGGGGGGGTISYSTTPVKIGTWVNGKDIYRRVYLFSKSITMSNSNWTDLGGSANIGECLLLECTLLAGVGNVILNTIRPECAIASGNIQVRGNSSGTYSVKGVIVDYVPDQSNSSIQ